MPSDRKGREEALERVLEKPQTYRIVRYYQWAPPQRTELTGLTLEQAQEHCKRADTRGDGWFDGYVAEL